MYELKTISIKSSARVFSFLLTVVYIVFAGTSLVSGTAAVSYGNGAVSLVIGIVLFAIIGAILGVLIAWLYNVVSKKWGGLHLDFRLIDESDKQEENQ